MSRLPASPETVLPRGIVDAISDEPFTAACAALAGLVLVLGLAFAGDGARDRRLARRIAQAAQASAPRSGSAFSGNRATPTLKRQDAPSRLGSLGAGVARLVPRTASLRARLDQAGVALAVQDFIMISALLALAAAAGALLLRAPLAVAAAAAMVGGLGLPSLALKIRSRRRARRFLALFPDALDLMVRGLRSGLPITEALNTLSQEAEEPIAPLFAAITADIRIGLSLGDALWAAAPRMPQAEFRFFVISVVIQQETGGNLAEILQNLSVMLRRRQQVHLKVRAMSSEARASAMIIGSLPFVTGTLIQVINPDYMSTLFEDPRGWVLLAAAATSLLMGVGVMAKMVRFEV